MIEHLRVQNPAKGLGDCELHGLGKLNVLCGKNNSGKTTILEAISNPQNSHTGVNLNDSNAEAVFEATINDFGWSSTDSRVMDYKGIVNGVIIPKQVWYTDEIEAIVEEIYSAAISKFRFSQKISLQKLLRNSIRSFFPNAHKTMLLPPKRSLEPLKNLDTSQAAHPAGFGILDCLALWKNSEEDSPNKALYNQIVSAFENISSGHKFSVFLRKSNQAIMRFSYKTSQWMNASDCGLGLQDLLVILFHAITSENDFLLIEEPENHIHPDMQRRLLHFLKNETSKQIFLSTHSNVFLDSAVVDRVFFTSFNGKINVDDATSRATILNDLGYSVAENLLSDLVILVEGPSDRPVLEEFLIKMELWGKYNIKIWSLGGDIMDQHDLSVFSERYNLVALTDKDHESEHIRKKFAAKCRGLNIDNHRLEKYSIENYFTVDALKTVFHSQIPIDFVSIASDIKLEEQIGIDVKKNNRKIARAMALDDIKGTDLFDFLERVGSICKESVSTK